MNRIEIKVILLVTMIAALITINQAQGKTLVYDDGTFKGYSYEGQGLTEDTGKAKILNMQAWTEGDNSQVTPFFYRGQPVHMGFSFNLSDPAKVTLTVKILHPDKSRETVVSPEIGLEAGMWAFYVALAYTTEGYYKVTWIAKTRRVVREKTKFYIVDEVPLRGDWHILHTRYYIEDHRFSLVDYPEVEKSSDGEIYTFREILVHQDAEEGGNDRDILYDISFEVTQTSLVIKFRGSQTWDFMLLNGDPSFGPYFNYHTSRGDFSFVGAENPFGFEQWVDWSEGDIRPADEQNLRITQSR